MDEKVWMIIIGVGGFALSQLFSILKDRTKNQEEKLNNTTLLLTQNSTKIALMERELEIAVKLKKDIDIAHERIREMNKEHVELFEVVEKLKKEIEDIYKAHME